MTSPESGWDVRALVRLEQLRQVARLWDELIPLPIVRRRIGLDALVGLVPGLGDVAGALVAGWGLVTAIGMGAPASVLARMLVNIGLDTLIGAIPFLGDIFDIGWHAQTRNVALLERWLADPDRASRQSALLLAVIAGGMVAVIVGAIWLAVVAIGWLLPF